MGRYELKLASFIVVEYLAFSNILKDLLLDRLILTKRNKSVSFDILRNDTGILFSSNFNVVVIVFLVVLVIYSRFLISIN